MLLVGSRARGEAGPDSDVDLVVLCDSPSAYWADLAWPGSLPWHEIGLGVESTRDEDYGLLWSRRVLLSSELEIEFGFVAEQWARTDPIDGGTLRVVSAGHRIVYDRDGMLRRLSECAAAKGVADRP